MRLVFDTSTLVAALRSASGASRQLLVAALEKRVTFLASVPLIIEYEAVLTRSEHLKASGLSVNDMNAILDAVAAVAEPVRLSFLWRPMLTDPDDDMVLETATNGHADYLVTFNKQDFGSPAKKLGCSVASPRDVLRELRRKQ